MSDDVRSVKNIAAKLAKVMAACSYVQKDKKHSFHDYKYASAEAILSSVNPACAENNVASVTCYELLSEKDVTNAKGKTEHSVTVKCILTIIDADSGEWVEAQSLGTGQDLGDKAVAKAQTMALKYAWLTSLIISTGDDPEHNEPCRQQDQQQKNKPTQSKKPQQGPKHFCSSCGQQIPETVLTFSLKKFSKALCLECQKAAVAKKE